MSVGAGEGRGAPTVWLLLGQKGGDNAQIRNLARLLGWPHAENQLTFNQLSGLPNTLLGTTLIGLKRSAFPLEPPWPDFVIACGKRSVPAALRVKKRSGGHTRLIHLGRPWAPLDRFDLVVTTPQYRLPERPNVIHNTFPVIRHDPARLDEEANLWRGRFETLPRPWIVLLAGGQTRPFLFDVRTGTALGEAASAFAREHGGSLLVTGSGRCPPESFQALARAVDCPSHIHDPHNTSGGNPYLAYLRMADMFVVTSDSVSMITEACLTGRPVHVFDLPVKYDRRMRWARFLRSMLVGEREPGRGMGSRVYEFLVEYGLLTSTRDQLLFDDVLRRKGLITRFGEAGALQPPDFSNERELENTLARIRSLAEQGSNRSGETGSAR